MKTNIDAALEADFFMGKNTLKFGGNIFIDMLSWQKDKNDLIAAFTNTGETLTIKD